MRDIDYGTVRIKLNELIEQQGISKNRLAHRAEMQRTQLNQYCNGEVTRLDIAVLARLCCALDCKVEDLLEYVPPEQSVNSQVLSFKAQHYFFVQIYLEFGR